MPRIKNFRQGEMLQAFQIFVVAFILVAVDDTEKRPARIFLQHGFERPAERSLLLAAITEVGEKGEETRAWFWQRRGGQTLG